MQLKQVTFYVTSHEGSVVLSCKTNLKLNLIHPCRNLNQVLECASLIYSSADHPMKKKLKKSMQEKYVNQCVKEKVPIQDEISKWECQANVYQEDDKNCKVNMRPVKSTVCSDKQCQDTKFMWPVKPKMDMWSMSRPTNLQSKYKKKDQLKLNQVSMNDDKNCWSPKFIQFVCSDKNC